jgi:hypothetical protein
MQKADMAGDNYRRATAGIQYRDLGLDTHAFLWEYVDGLKCTWEGVQQKRHRPEGFAFLKGLIGSLLAGWLHGCMDGCGGLVHNLVSPHGVYRGLKSNAALLAARLQQAGDPWWLAGVRRDCVAFLEVYCRDGLFGLGTHLDTHYCVR